MIPQVHCGAIKMVPISDLKPHPRNPNKHTVEQIERLALILKYQGWRYPIKVSNQSGFVTSGHGRIEAAKLNQWTHVPVSYQDYENEDQEYADVISDNSIAEWSDLDLSMINFEIQNFDPSFDINLLGLKNFVIEPAEKFEAKIPDDEVPDVKDTRVKLGDIWQLGRHRLMCGDSTNIDVIDKLIDGVAVDMVFTDPPYGMSVVKKDGNNNGLGQSTDGVVGVAARGRYRPVIGDNGTKTAIDAYNLCSNLDIPKLVFWGGNFYAEALAPSSGWIVWDKENGEGFFADGELAWTNDEKQLRIFRHQWKGMIRDSERGEKRVHPTQKPIALAEWVFENYGNPQVVLDLFGGSGSTLIACQKTNRTCFMMELDPHYCSVILARWEKYTGQLAERIIEGEMPI